MAKSRFKEPNLANQIDFNIKKSLFKGSLDLKNRVYDPKPFVKSWLYCMLDLWQTHTSSVSVAYDETWHNVLC